MRKHILFCTLFAAALSLQGQNVWIHRGQTVVTLTAEQAGEMTYSNNGTILSIAGTTYDVSQIDSITIEETCVAENTVQVEYADARTRVLMPAALQPFVTSTLDGAHVSLVSSVTGGDEITYILSGNASDGSFTMDGEYKCGVQLNGLTLTSQRGAAIDIQNGKRIDIRLTEGTVNTLSDFAGGSQKACFFVNGHPEIKGGGTLILYGNAKHAFASDEYTQLKHSTGTIEVRKAVSDGFHCKQYFLMEGGNLSISGTDGDGIQAEITKDATDEQNGQLHIAGGSIRIDVTGTDVKGIRSDSLMTITGGNIVLNVSGDGAKGISSDTDLYLNEDNNPLTINIQTNGNVYVNPNDPLDDSKCMGIRTKKDLHISAGRITVTCSGEKNKTIKVSGMYYGPGNALLQLSSPIDY